MTDEIITSEELEVLEQDAPEELLPQEDAEAAPLPERVTVVDIQFRSGSKVYFFDPGELELKAGDHVIMDTARGHEFGYCSGGNHEVSARDIVPPLRKILRIATEKDEKINNDNIQKEKKAFEICQQKIQAHGLDMQLVSAECAFDGSKIIFFFTADGRVDFRELVKNLASVFRTRIELRQIGVRDKAKMVGGLGICGRPFCCKEFLDDFQPVSIKMAKTQNLSLNPTKISGTCGRLMCCLKYEQNAYEDAVKRMPKNESFVDTPDGVGNVSSVDLLREEVQVRLDNAPESPKRYKNCEICVLRNGKGSRDGIEIPKERPTRYVPSRPAEEEEPRAIQRPAAPISVPSAVAAEEPEETGEKSEHRRRRSRGGRRSGGEKSKTAAPEKQEKQEKKPEKPKAEKQEKPEKKAENSRGRNARGDKAPRGEKQPRGDKPAKTEKQPKAEREPKVEKVAVRSNSDTTAEKKAAADRAARQQSGEAKAGEGKSGEHKPHRRRHHHRPRSKGQGGGQGSAE